MTRLIGAPPGESEFPAKRPECPVVPGRVRSRDTLPDALLIPPLRSRLEGESVHVGTLLYTHVYTRPLSVGPLGRIYPARSLVPPAPYLTRSLPHPLPKGRD